MFRPLFLRTVKRISTQNIIKPNFNSLKRTQINFFSDTPKKNVDLSEDLENKAAESKPKIIFTDQELKATPLFKSTYFKLLDGVEDSVKSKFIEDLELIEKNRTQIKNLKTEVNAIHTVEKENKQALISLKTIIEQERAESTRLVERYTKKLENEKIFAISKFSVEILESVDNLERLLKNCKSEEGTETYNGVEMIYKNMLGILNRFEITPIESPLDEKVNLDYHDIIFHAPYPGKENDTVLDVSQKGFMIGSRVLRPSKVGVVKNY